MAIALVRFDDRLQTVLRQPASDPRDAAVRWRQLVDLIARAGPSIDSQLLGEALNVIAGDASRIDESLRAAAARTIAALPLPFRLLEYFVGDQLSVSAPILAAASLERAQWTTLLALADPETRQFVATLHPELGDMAPADMTDDLVEYPDRTEQTTISDVVARIERRRHRRPEWDERGAQHSPVTPSELGVFRWECGPNGEIGWVEGAPRGALIGRSIARARDNGDRIEEAAVRAFSQRAPFRDALMVLAGDGPVAGKWKISGVPAFDPADGRFAGYRGIALREFSAPQQGLPQGSATLAMDSDSLRELVHEIKTPLNAIIGFAEIIDGQYLGPAGRRYRQRATGIVDQARLLLGAIDDLDLMARVQSGASPASGPGDLGEIVTRTVNDLRPSTEQDGVELIYAAPRTPVRAATGIESLIRLVERTIAAAADLATSGERLRCGVARSQGQARLTITRPSELTHIGSLSLADDNGGAIDGRFSLHVARGLARLAGGDLVIEGDNLVLSVPSA
ncbi:MAG: HAMP domain-containing histidine kinase [Sphingomonas sp.]|nr:HAMP domain-containing histidine kinase [Sphingomonas sp.]